MSSFYLFSDLSLAEPAAVAAPVEETVVEPVDETVAVAEPAGEAIAPASASATSAAKSTKRHSLLPSGFADKIKKILHKALPKSEKEKVSATKTTETVISEPPVTETATEPAVETATEVPVSDAEAAVVEAEPETAK